MSAIQAFPHSTTVSLAKQHQIDPANNWLEHLAPCSTGIFFFGRVQPRPQENVYVRKALMTTSHVFRHFLRPSGLELEVVNEVVHLRGGIPADVIVILAEQLARQIDGVDNVSNETTKVLDKSPGGRRIKSVAHAETDQEVLYRLKLILETDQSLAPLGLRIAVRNDKATVSGTVTTNEQADWVEHLCRELEGARRIDLRLRVERKEAAACSVPVDGDSVQAIFQTRLRLLKSTRRLRIETRCEQRCLRLEGVAPSQATKALVETLAATTCGAREVASALLAPDER